MSFFTDGSGTESVDRTRISRVRLERDDSAPKASSDENMSDEEALVFNEANTAVIEGIERARSDFIPIVRPKFSMLASGRLPPSYDSGELDTFVVERLQFTQMARF